MTLTTWIETLGPAAAVLAPMVGVPLTAITFYLRSLRDTVLHGHATLAQRIEAVESGTRELRRRISDIPRDFTTKEEWLRELLHTRRVLEQVTEATIRLQATLDGWCPPRHDQRLNRETSAPAGPVGGRSCDGKKKRPARRQPSEAARRAAPSEPPARAPVAVPPRGSSPAIAGLPSRDESECRTRLVDRRKGGE